MQEALALIIIAIFGAWIVAWIRAYKDTDDKKF